MKDRIPIIVSSAFPDSLTYDTGLNLQYLEECGINMFICVPPNGSPDNYFCGLCKMILNSGIKLIPGQGAFLRNKYEAFIAECDKEVVGGYMLRDEPTICNWDSYIKDGINMCELDNLRDYQKENLRELYDGLREQGYFVFFNLAASSEEKYIGNSGSYEAYLRKFNEVFHPPVWMFDYYPVQVDHSQTTSDNTVWLVRYKVYYSYLKMFRDIAIETGNPFWSYCQSVSYYLNGKLAFPVPDENMLRWEAFTSLVFGAKGIAYWYYAQRGKVVDTPDDDATDTNGIKYKTSPISVKNVEGKLELAQEDSWYDMKKVNDEIISFTKVFLNTELVRLFQTNKDNFKDGELIDHPYLALDSITAPGAGLIVSHFKENDLNYFVMVSKYVEKGLNAKEREDGKKATTQIVTIRFKKRYHARFLGKGGDDTMVGGTKILGDIEEIEWTVGPGGYLIFEWDNKDVDPEYISPTPGEIPVIASSVYPESSVPERSDFVGAAECGFNAIVGWPNHLEKLYKSAEGTGVKIILAQAAYPAMDFEKFVEAYKGNPNTGAWTINDQPYIFNLFPGSDVRACDVSKLPPSYNENLSTLFDNVRRMDPEHMVYFNLPASEDPCWIGNYGNYENYLKALQIRFKPAVWMFALYPVLGSDNDFRVEYRYFYTYLEYFRRMSASSGRPFWYYCQSVSLKYNGKVHFPTPSVAMMRFEVFSALAFGAKGIAFWYYAQRKDDEKWKYIISPVTAERKRTYVWNYVKTVISEIRKFSEVFLDTEVVKVMESSFPYYLSGSGLALPYEPLVVLRIGGNTNGMIVSHLRKSGLNYLVITSRDFKNKQNVTTKFKSDSHVVEMGGGGIISRKVIQPSIYPFGEEIEWELEEGAYK